MIFSCPLINFYWTLHKSMKLRSDSCRSIEAPGKKATRISHNETNTTDQNFHEIPNFNLNLYELYEFWKPNTNNTRQSNAIMFSAIIKHSVALHKWKTCLLHTYTGSIVYHQNAYKSEICAINVRCGRFSNSQNWNIIKGRTENKTSWMKIWKN